MRELERIRTLYTRATAKKALAECVKVAKGRLANPSCQDITTYIHTHTYIHSCRYHTSITIILTLFHVFISPRTKESSNSSKCEYLIAKTKIIIKEMYNVCMLKNHLSLHSEACILEEDELRRRSRRCRKHVCAAILNFVCMYVLHLLLILICFFQTL